MGLCHWWGQELCWDLVCTSVGRSSIGEQSRCVLGRHQLDWSGKGKEECRIVFCFRESRTCSRKGGNIRLEWRVTEHIWTGFKFGEARGRKAWGLASRIREMNGILRRINFYFGKEILREYAGLPSLSGISWTEINACGFSSSAGLTAAVLYSWFTSMHRNAWNFSSYGSPIRSTVS